MRKPSPAMLVALAALFVALSGVGVAATGGNFILGQSNTADQQTQLSGTVAGNPQLRVQNAATSGASRAIVGRMTAAGATGASAGVLGATASTDPASAGVLAQNTGGGPALSAQVNAGVAPFTVNSSTKVTNLNADLLDGVDSSDLRTRNLGTGTASGGLPVIVSPVTTHGGPLLVFLSGSGFRSSPGTIEVDLSIDGVVSAKTSVYTSETGSHKALVPTMTVVNPTAGSHLVTITAALGSLTDTNDSFSYSFIELPPT